MPDISKITLPDGVTYDIKDTVARGGGGGAYVPGTLVAVYTAATYDLELLIQAFDDADAEEY